MAKGTLAPTENDELYKPESVFHKLKNGEKHKCPQCGEMKERSDWFSRKDICDHCHDGVLKGNY